jgi:hypothetical protein
LCAYPANGGSMATPTIEELEGLNAEVACEVSRCPRKARVPVMWAHHSKMTCRECSVELSDREWLHVSMLFGSKPHFAADGKVLHLPKPKTTLNFTH